MSAISNIPLNGAINTTAAIKTMPAKKAKTVYLFENNLIFTIDFSFLQLKQWNNLAIVKVKNAIVEAHASELFKPI